MSPTTLLFCLRLLSAALLLGFLGFIAWLIYQDLRLTTTFLAQQTQVHGHLRLLNEEDAGPEITFPLLTVTSIGRANSCTIILNNNYVSNRHALITRRGDQWWLEDLNSRNGTRLNDLPLTNSMVISPR